MNHTLTLSPTISSLALRNTPEAVPVSRGFNSDVWVIPEYGIVIKKVGGIKKITLTPREAHTLGKQMSKYRTRLIEKGVPVPSSFEVAVISAGNNGSCITELVMFEPYSGLDAAALVQQANPAAAEQLTLGILSSIKPFLGQGTTVQTVGIDPKTSNFTVSDTGTIVYIDFMPPRHQKGDKTYLVEYPNLTDPEELAFWLWKYFTSEGILTIALYQLGRLRPDLFQEIKGHALAFLQERGYHQEIEFLRYLEYTTEEHVRQVTNPLLLRLFMCEIASRSHVPTDIVEQFFHLTHFEGSLPEEKLDQAQQMLLVYA